jgi:hypothetical protein
MQLKNKAYNKVLQRKNYSLSLAISAEHGVQAVEK